MSTLSTQGLRSKLVALLGFDLDRAAAIERKIHAQWAQQGDVDLVWSVPEPLPRRSFAEALDATIPVTCRTATLAFRTFGLLDHPRETTVALYRIRGFDGNVVWEWSPNDGRPRAASPFGEEVPLDVESELVAGATQDTATLHSARQSLEGE